MDVSGGNEVETSFYFEKTTRVVQLWEREVVGWRCFEDSEKFHFTFESFPLIVASKIRELF